MKEDIKHQETKSIESLIQSTMKNLHTLIEANTIIGEPVYTPDGAMIIPISRVSVGYVVGGGEYADVSVRKKISSYPLAGGSGGGMSVTPVGFLIENNGEVNFVDIENKSAYQTVLNLINKLVNKICEKGE